MGEAKYLLTGQPAGRILQKKRPPGSLQPARLAAFFLKIWPPGRPANHVFGFPHPSSGYINGIGILLGLIMDSIFLIMGGTPMEINHLSFWGRWQDMNYCSESQLQKVITHPQTTFRKQCHQRPPQHQHV